MTKRILVEEVRRCQHANLDVVGGEAAKKKLSILATLSRK
jgi:hypothetical protein